MKKGDGDDFVTYNDAQCVTATSTIARAISQLRKDTLGTRRGRQKPMPTSVGALTKATTADG